MDKDKWQMKYLMIWDLSSAHCICIYYNAYMIAATTEYFHEIYTAMVTPKRTTFLLIQRFDLI